MTRVDVTNGQKTTGHDGCTGGIRFALGGLYTLQPTWDNSGVILSDWYSGEPLAQADHGRGLNDDLWSPDGHWIATNGSDGTVRVWKVVW